MRQIAENACEYGAMTVGKLLDQISLDRGFDTQTSTYIDVMQYRRLPSAIFLASLLIFLFPVHPANAKCYVSDKYDYICIGYSSSQQAQKQAEAFQFNENRAKALRSPAPNPLDYYQGMTCDTTFTGGRFYYDGALARLQSSLEPIEAAENAAQYGSLDSPTITTVECGDSTFTRKWTPPPLDNSITVTITGDRHHQIVLNKSDDYIVTCNGASIEGSVSIKGGRSVVVRDCNIHMQCSPPSMPTNDPRHRHRGLYIKGFTGSVLSFENLKIDSSNCVSDTIAVNPASSNKGYDAYFYNSILLAGDGHAKGFHADIFQDQSPTDKHRNLYIEHVLGGSWYSGFTAYYADNTYVRKSAILPNSEFGKTCTGGKNAGNSYSGGSAAVTNRCGKSLKGGKIVINPSYMGDTLHAEEDVYAWGCAPCQSKKLVGTVKQSLDFNNFTCLPYQW